MWQVSWNAFKWQGDEKPHLLLNPAFSSLAQGEPMHITEGLKAEWTLIVHVWMKDTHKETVGRKYRVSCRSWVCTW